MSDNPQINFKKVLKPGLPHLAYILLWYPLFTQPFIYREVEGLREELPLEIYTLYGKNLRHCSQDMKENANRVRSYGFKELLSLFYETGRAFITRPIKTGKLFKNTCLNRWASLEIFGENLWAFGVGIKLARQFKEDGIDFIYAPWPRGTATAAKIASHLTNIPFAMAVRGDNLEPADPDLEAKLESAFLVRANNKADKKRIENFGSKSAENKTRLVYNALSLPPDNDANVTGINKRLTDGTLKILAVGRFDVTKGFDILIKACAILKEKRIPFKLTLVGGGGRLMGLGKLEKELRHLRKSLNLENEIDLPGFMSHDQLPNLLREHDIFAAPCVIHNSGRRDGIPNTVIEAMAFGMPVIVSNIHALPEIVRNNETGLTVEPQNPQALADAIIWMKDHPDSARTMGKNGQSFVYEMFDAKQNSKKLADILIQNYQKNKL